jgi:glycosyltransferase involved in cell wall biosynthesis
MVSIERVPAVADPGNAGDHPPPRQAPTMRPLRIALVHAADAGGGAERSVLTLHQSLLRLGHDCSLYVGYKHTNEPGVIEIERVRGVPGLQRLARTVEGAAGLQGLYAPGFRRLIRRLSPSTDVVHMHSLWGAGHYADMWGLSLAASRFGTILTLRDEWMLTGHCACTHLCERWRIGCGQCPDLTIPPRIERDGTALNFQLKRRIMQRSHIHVTTVSRYLQDKAEQSPIMRGRSVTTIYNGIDLVTFSPGDQKAARQALGLPVEGFFTLLAGQTIEGIRRGIAQQAAEALRRLNHPRVTPLLVGHSAGLVAATLPISSIVLPFQALPEAMAQCYRAADLTLVSSEVETFGRIAAESQACGTPVITTDAGGLPEVVQHGTGGLVVPNRDVDAFLGAIQYLIGDAARREAMARAGVDWVARNFADQTVAASYVALYERVLAERSSISSQ